MSSALLSNPYASPCQLAVPTTKLGDLINATALALGVLGMVTAGLFSPLAVLLGAAGLFTSHRGKAALSLALGTVGSVWFAPRLISLSHTLDFYGDQLWALWV